MSIEKLEVFASQADKNTDGITLKYGFPSAEKPARQWFNWLFYTQTSKINEVADLANSNFTRVKDIDLKYEQLKRDTTKQLQDTASSLQDVRDYADQLMQTAVGGKLAYKTYAEMIADKASIATNSSIDIIADTDDKNGTYLYDGTNFVKSNYDLEKLIRAKVQNTFDTYAQMVASNLSDGAYALVADDADDKNGIYIKEGGTWVKSKYDFNNLVSLIDNDSDILKAIDANGIITFRQNNDGDFILPNIGNLTDQINNLRKSITTTPKEDKIFNKDGVFFHKDDVSGLVKHKTVMVRIPSILRISDYKYLLFAEIRGEGGDHGEISLMSSIVTYSPETKDVSWGNPVIIDEMYRDSNGQINSFMNGCGVVLDNGDIICMYIKRQPADNVADRKQFLYTRTSKDGGLTWSSLRNLSEVQGTRSILCPCQKGIVKHYGQNKGRIIFPAWASGETYALANHRSGYIYSDDNGATWNVGGFVPTVGSNEVQVSYDIDGNLYLMCRVDGASDGTKKKLFKIPDGNVDVFEEINTNVKLTQESVMTGFIQNTNWFDGGKPYLFFTSCVSESTRRGLLIRVSFDNGHTWTGYYDKAISVENNINVGYTSAENTKDGLKLIAYESFSRISYKLIDDKVAGV